ncbi:MAG: flavodoxin [Kiritimatiellae bacterium]|nr:flavodoxin [Kiritimatiellia bacterium]
MKKLSCGLVVLVTVICLFDVIAAKAEERQSAQMRNLVVYYSYTGNTELAAKTLAEIIKADIIKIEDVDRPSKDKAYKAGKEASIQGKSWPVKPFKTDLSAYDRIFVGCPVWFGMPTPEFNAFVEQVDFSGKQVVVFVTLGGGGYDKAVKSMTEKVAAKGGKVVSSFFIRTKTATKDDIVNKTKEISAQFLPAPAVAR